MCLRQQGAIQQSPLTSPLLSFTTDKALSTYSNIIALLRCSTSDLTFTNSSVNDPKYVILQNYQKQI